MNQAETFEWLRQRSNRLDEVEAELRDVRARLIECQLGKARLTVKPIIDREKKGEEIGDLMNMRLDAATTPAEGEERQDGPPELTSDDDYGLIRDAVSVARGVQEFIWADCYPALRPYDAEGWRVLFQKRVDSIAAVDLTRPGGLPSLRKRLLQQAALSIKALALVNRWAEQHAGNLLSPDGTDLALAATAKREPHGDMPHRWRSVQWLAEHPYVEHDEYHEQRRHTTNENSLSDREHYPTTTPSVAGVREHANDKPNQWAAHEENMRWLDEQVAKGWPTEEQAEVILREHGTSGKEVVNEFIERLLRARLHLQDAIKTFIRDRGQHEGEHVFDSTVCRHCEESYVRAEVVLDAALETDPSTATPAVNEEVEQLRAEFEVANKQMAIQLNEAYLQRFQSQQEVAQLRAELSEARAERDRFFKELGQTQEKLIKLIAVVDIGTSDDPGTALTKMERIQATARVKAIGECAGKCGEAYVAESEWQELQQTWESKDKREVWNAAVLYCAELFESLADEKGGTDGRT